MGEGWIPARRCNPEISGSHRLQHRGDLQRTAKPYLTPAPGIEEGSASSNVDSSAVVEYLRLVNPLRETYRSTDEDHEVSGIALDLTNGKVEKPLTQEFRDKLGLMLIQGVQFLGSLHDPAAAAILDTLGSMLG